MALLYSLEARFKITGVFSAFPPLPGSVSSSVFPVSSSDVLSNAEVAAFFQMYDAPIKKVGTSKTINTKIIPKTENDYTKYTNWVYEHDKDDGSDPFGDDVDEHIM